MKKFFKKPLNVFSFALVVLGLIGVIVMLVVPHGAKYSRTYKDEDGKVVSVYELKGGKIYNSVKLGDEWVTEDVLLGEYEVKGGKLSYKVGDIGVELGKINAFRFIPKGESENYTCKMTVVFFVIACVMVVAGSSGMIYGIVTNKKPKSKAKTKRKKK